MEPRPWCLAEPVERLAKLTDVRGSIGADKTRRLLAVDGHVELAVQEGVLHVQLVNGSARRYGKAEDDPDRRWLHHWTEGLTKVDARPLGEASKHPSRLVSCESTVGMQLVAEDPLPGHRMNTCRASNKRPRIVLQQSTILITHSGVPVGIFESLFVVGGDRRDGSVGGHGDERMGEKRFFGCKNPDLPRVCMV